MVLVHGLCQAPWVLRTVITLSLLAQPREEGLAGRESVTHLAPAQGTFHTSRAIRSRSQSQLGVSAYGEQADGQASD